MRSLLSCAAMMAAVSCQPAGETPMAHAVNRGQRAFLRHAGMRRIPVAATKDVVHELARAVETNDSADVARLAGSGKAFEVDSHTAVQVVSGSFQQAASEDRRGPGWAPYEWLQPTVAP